MASTSRSRSSHPKDVARDGSAPLLLEAYGAYGVSEAPEFWPSLVVWLERGGVYAVAHVRGGGELGDDWHRGGYHATKPNPWRDLIATAQWLDRRTLDHAGQAGTCRQQRRGPHREQCARRASGPLCGNDQRVRLSRCLAQRNGCIGPRQCRNSERSRPVMAPTTDRS